MQTTLSEPPTPTRTPHPGRPLRVAVIGCGAIAKSMHLPVLAGHEGVELAALVDRDRERAAELAAGYKVPAVLADAAELGPDRIDAAVVATPPFHHAAHVCGSGLLPSDLCRAHSSGGARDVLATGARHGFRRNRLGVVDRGKGRAQRGYGDAVLGLDRGGQVSTKGGSHARHDTKSPRPWRPGFSGTVGRRFARNIR